MLELLGTFILAILPIVWLIVALLVLHITTWKAALGSAAIALVCALAGWQMPVVDALTAALEGVISGFWPIVIVVIAAVFTYNLTVHTGAMETMKRMLCSVSTDKRVLTLLIGWCFGCFLEGVAGFGTPVAIPASMLITLGIDPVTAIIVCLMCDGMPAMFGAVGTPTTTVATITGLESGSLAFLQSLLALPFSILMPFLVVMFVGGGRKALKGMVPITLVAGVSFGVTSIVAAYFVGASMPSIMGGVCALVLTFAFALRGRNAEVPEEYRITNIPEQDESETMGDKIRAWSPYIIIFVALLLTSSLFPAIANPLSSIKTVINVYTGDSSATITLTWVNNAGVIILICGFVGGLVQRCPMGEILQVLGATCKQMVGTIITILSVMACAKVMGYSGMISSIAVFFVTLLGPAFPLVSPLLGTLGTFVTGSSTSSEVLFGNLQLQAAESLGIEPSLLVAGNSIGTGPGNMLSPQNIALGCSSTGIEDQHKDGEILARIAPYGIGVTLLMAVEVFVVSLVM